jgi:TolB protein
MRYLFGIVILCFSLKGYAVDPIYITKGNAQAIPIAINYFKASNTKESDLANQVIHVIQNDLEHSGIFRSINQSSFIDNSFGYSMKPDFSSWRTINANFLLNGSIERVGSNRIIIKIALWDVYNEKNIFAAEYESDSSGIRRLSHKISDQVFETITGEKGYFDTQIVYVSESGSDKRKTRHIAIMDYDGENHKYVTDGKNIVLTPRLSPNKEKMLYLSYEGRRPRVVLHDLKKNKKVILGTFSGMSFAPRFSPVDDKALISIAKNGHTDIFEVYLSAKKMKRLTNDGSINTSPCYSPDGKEIIFNSDRDGTRQLYIMDPNGHNIRKVSGGDGNYYSPVWSPRGDYIAFTKVSADLGFSIGIMKPDGSGERILANGYLVESPTWSPSGRYVLFTRSYKQDSKGATRSKLYRIDITGRNEKEIKTPINASGPEWSSLSD